MIYTAETEKYCYSITIESKQKGISCVVCFKNFIQPTTNDKTNSKKIEKMEEKICSLIKKNIESSSILSSNYIVDFDCTKNNLNTEKWSRLKIDLYLMSKNINNNEKLIDELSKICENIGIYIEKFTAKNGLLTNVIVP